MKKYFVFALIAFAIMLLIVSSGIAGAAFTAYNDTVWGSGHTALKPNVTNYGIVGAGGASAGGYLVDYVTGAVTTVMVAATTDGGDVSFISGSGGNCSSGTDASNVFNGIADLTGVQQYGTTGWYFELTFTGLDPNKIYEFVTTGNRADSGYTSRTTKFSILDADSYANESTLGTTIAPDGSYTIFSTGNNSTNGHVARWTRIASGSDGSFTVRAQASNINNAYGFSAFMLMEIDSAPDAEPSDIAAKNVILMIGDGMGFKHVEATRNYVGSPLAMEALPVHLGCTTFPIGGSYNSALAATTFSYLNGGATDSAAAATALATGTKTSSGRISVNSSGTSRLTSISEHVRAFSKAVGAITTVPFSHATPAGFSAHNSDRNKVTVIAREMIMGIGDGDGAWGNTPTADVIIGGGRNTTYIGSTEYNALKNGTTGEGWTFVERQTGIDGGNAILSASQSATKLFGLFGDGAEDLPYRLADGSGYTLENPNLAEMSLAAINVLDNNPNGFFLMIEGGAIDHGSHDNNINVMIGEAIDFDNAVSAVINWINTNDPAWSETLLIVTADHETGYLTRGSSVLPSVPLGNPGAGILPTSGTHYRWNITGHTNSPVPVFAKGVGTDRLEYYAAKYDSLYNINYLDDTDIFRTICRAMTNPSTLSEARSAEDNQLLGIYDSDTVVTASYDDAFWVEKRNRSAGIKVISGAKPAIGKKVNVIGQIMRENSEVAISASSVIDAGAGTIIPPVGITGKVAAELDKDGAAAQGLLVKMAGRVTAVTKDGDLNVNGYFLDDGSELAGDGTNKGLYVILDPTGETPDTIEGTFMTETGPLTAVEMNGSPLPAIRGALKDPVTYTAYNDCSFASGDLTYNITTHTLGSSNECLKDYITGRDLSVRVSMTNYSNMNVYAGYGVNCAAGTDAANIFGGKVSLVGTINYTSAGAAWMEVVITGLDPNGVYELAATANRNGSTYTARTTKFSILDAQSFTNQSSTGTTFSGPSDPTDIFSTGYNTVNGYVARWTNIIPSANGTFRIRAENPTGVTQTYGLSALMLRKTQ